jgi:deoxyadenosine/deoxycytidine kinase
MWVVITGPVGTAKTKLAEVLLEDDFIFLDAELEKREQLNGYIENEFDKMIQRYKLQERIAKEKEKKDFVTVRSHWDSAIFALAHYKAHIIEERDCRLIVEMVEALGEITCEPDIIVMANFPQKITAMDRLKMKHGDIVTDEFLDAIRNEYEIFYERVGKPKLEIDSSQTMDKVINDFKFYMASVKTTMVSESTIWKKDFLNGIWLE